MNGWRRVRTLLPLSLFWRNFLAFWPGMAAIVGIGMALTAAMAWYRFEALDGLSPAALTADAIEVARTQGRPGLRRWLRAMDSHASALDVYIVDPALHDMLGRQLPTRLRNHLADRIVPMWRAGMNGHGVAHVPRPGARVSWWDPQPIALPDGSEALLLFLPFDSSRWEVLHLSPVALALGLFALAVSAPLCWALTRHVTGPVRRLRAATQALADGALATRTAPVLARRADELGQLARDFDAMADRLQRLVDWREQLLRNIAHELRSPLGRLRLSLELARRRDATLALQFERIERETERLDALVERTLQLARLHAMAPVRDPIDLAGLVDVIVADARFEAAARGVAIRWTAPDELIFDADAAALGSAIENILRNAIRYTEPAAPVSVTLQADAHEIRLDIVDGGPGVPAAALASLFEPFYRVRSGPGHPAGAGLGLSIAHAGIAAHGGTVSARNAQPRGLAVSVYLPRRA
ncbi:Signal transduction histidine kinase sensor protein activates cpxR by phosphorylation (plasmid) [Cupriavidus taiwanensis]|uniref:Signal transduction histidine-protein kinase/phosphatase MprB n=1 Tax=Cupriavidus taiwanensis TaxID=164546 RepID=A0A375IRR8_9BURK|nr:ATP-binding protein [Cupriavidus taiwanensis]SPK76838.1 Signal transduction histidine kinase sensor protein activates cpxR by phosphorylation [Cupriavidus taiwanensis]